MQYRFSHGISVLLTAFGLMAALWVSASAADSQQKPRSNQDPAGQSQTTFTFKVPVNAVLVNVTVTDKAGKPVKDLTVDDFKLYEDGKLQQIQSFELESTQPVGRKELVDPAGVPPGTTTPGEPAPEEPEGERTRLISCFIDDLTARSPRYYFWVVSALQQFIAEEMGPQDQVGVFSASGSVQIPFTNNQTLLQKKIGQLHVGNCTCPVLTAADVPS